MTEHGFTALNAAAGKLGARTDLALPELRDLLCRDCDFFHEDHEEELKCSCFRMLRLLLARGELTPAGLARALSPETPAE